MRTVPDSLDRPYVPRMSHRDRLAARRTLLDRGVFRLLTICAELGDIEAVYAFGSYARGDIGIASDLDVLVVRKTNARRAERDIAIRVAFDVPIGLDCIVVTPEEFRDVLPTTSFGRTILTTAVRLDAIR
ncbi:MAG: hypothetical protein NVS1B2_27520 [Vulcanimicrobiaceae bacterium]